MSATEQARFPSEETMACPFDFYASLRAQGCPHQANGGDEFLVTRFEDIAFINRHPELFSSEHSTMEDGYMRTATIAERDERHHKGLAGIGASGMVNSDPPVHTAKRKIAFQYFKPGYLRRREAMVQSIVDELIDGFVDRGRVEFVDEFAAPLPPRVIFDICDLPPEDVPKGMEWGRYEGAGTRYAKPERQAAARGSLQHQAAYIREQLIDRHDSPRDDMLSDFVKAHVEQSGRFDVDNLIADAANLLIGGIITTRHMLSSAMMLLLQNPDQMEKVRNDFSLIPRMIEETLRVESPVQWQPRLCLADTEVGGTMIPAGSLVLVLYASANRDEEHFPQADHFDVQRGNLREHVAFGYGIHFCIGAPLARLEGKLAFETLFRRLGDIRLADGNDTSNIVSTIFRGPRELHLEFDPA